MPEKPGGRRVVVPAAQRLEILRRAEIVGDEKAAREGGVSPHTLKVWRHRGRKRDEEIRRITDADVSGYGGERKGRTARALWRDVEKLRGEVLRRVEQNKISDAKNVALTLTGLLDKSLMLEREALATREADLHLDQQRDRLVTEAYALMAEPCGLPPEVGVVLGKLLHQASQGEAMVPDMAAADRARLAIKAVVRREVEREIRTEMRAEFEAERRPLALPQGDDGEVEEVEEEIVDGEVVDGSPLASGNPVAYLAEDAYGNDPSRPAAVRVEPRTQNWSDRYRGY